VRYRRLSSPCIPIKSKSTPQRTQRLGISRSYQTNTSRDMDQNLASHRDGITFLLVACAIYAVSALIKAAMCAFFGQQQATLDLAAESSGGAENSKRSRRVHHQAAMKKQEKKGRK